MAGAVRSMDEIAIDALRASEELSTENHRLAVNRGVLDSRFDRADYAVFARSMRNLCERPAV